MASRESGSHIAVFFFDQQQVSRQMLFSEFEALLDGLGALPEYNDEDAQAAYLVIGGDGQIRSVVFFKLYFDEAGCADSGWNVPVERLAEISGKGPDLGGGPIRLACRSQCSINWHQEDLWDPDMNPGANHFHALKKSVEENRLRFKFELPEDDIPMLSSTGEELAGDRSVDESERRTKLARLLKEQRLRIRTLESYKGSVDDKSEREARIMLHSCKSEVQELKRAIQQLKVRNENLQLKLTSRNEQFLDLQDKVSGQAQLVADLEEKLKGASVGERESLQRQKLEAEVVLLKEQLDRRDLDLAYRDEREELLRAELDEFKESQMDGQHDDGIIERLRELEVVYVVYHPGAGHITMTSSEIREYVENPCAFVAGKCFVTEEHYKSWLAHFENPVCHHRTSAGVTCHHSIEKVSVPSEYELGVSDRCAAHQPIDMEG